MFKDRGMRDSPGFVRVGCLQASTVVSLGVILTMAPLPVPASPLFEAQPWQIPPSDPGSDAE